jgi:hypothetical protein
MSLIAATPQIRRSAGVVPLLRHQLPTSGMSSLQETHMGRPVAIPKLLSAMKTYSHVRS